MDLTNSKTLTIALDNKLRERLQAIADDIDASSQKELFLHILKTYEGRGEEKPQDKKTKPSTIPKPSPSLFIAEIDEMDQEAISSMRKGMYQKYRYKDPQIIAYWSQVWANLQKNDQLLLSPFKELKQLILKKGQPQVDAGKANDLADYAARQLHSKLKGW
ncbi:MAG: hypothetical protein AAF388_01930 [Bacteroidota bacterium]